MSAVGRLRPSRHGRRALQVRIGRDRIRRKGSRTGSGRCCRACSPTSCRAGGYASLGFHLGARIANCRSGSRRRACSVRTRIAVNCAFCHTATYRTAPGCAAHDRARRRDDDDDAAGILAVSRSRGRGPAVQRRRHARRDREDRPACRGPSRSRTGRCSFRARGEALMRHREEFAWMDSAAQLGPRPDRPAQPVQVSAARPADRRHDRQLRHDAALGARACAMGARCIGTA